ncbi:MAG: hypothetical protein RJA59_1318, partial [Pseudomonadota bacterium]
MIPRAALALLLALAGLPALGQVRPSEEDMFGKPAEPSYPRPGTVPPAPPPDAKLETASPQPEGFGAPPAPPDPLKLGGMLYLRLDSVWSQGLPPSEWALT